MPELLARVRALLRRLAAGPDGSVPPYRYQGLVVDFGARGARLHELELPLTRREYEVLAYLAHNAGSEVCGCDDSVRYEIRMDGILDERWSSWFDGLEIATEAVGVTVMTGPVADQAALYGLLAKFRDRRLPLISVRRLDSESPSDGDSDATPSP
jgi:hypothetical protein